MRIIVIEDEPQLARQVSRALTRNGHEVVELHDGPGGLAAVLAQPPDLVVLDLNLPGMDGFTVLSRIRGERVECRVLILTARGEVEHRVKGLKSGADDYLAKPFSMEELVARIDALGRRGGATSPREVLRVGDLEMDLVNRKVTRRGVALALSPRELDVLQTLMQEPGRVFSRTELCERVWKRDHGYDSRTVEIFITRLRKKVDADFTPPLIHTERGAGYTILAPGTSQ